MAIGNNSYGDTGEIASMVPKYVNEDSPGVFDTTTRPTLLQIESFTDQVSGIVNGMLAKYGFTIPVSDTDSKLALDLFVNMEVASLSEGVNGLGKFGPSTKKGGGKGRWAVLYEDVAEYIRVFASGFEAMGATRSGATTLTGLGYMETDNEGDAVFPIRTRQEFDNTFKEWDAA
jgi:hypothetical protein